MCRNDCNIPITKTRSSYYFQNGTKKGQIDVQEINELLEREPNNPFSKVLI